MASASAPLLNIDTFIERAVVTIHGDAYEMLMPEELSVGQYVRLDKLRDRFNAAWSSGAESVDSLSQETADEIDEVVNAIVRIVLLAPEEIQGRLNSLHKMMIYKAFQKLQTQGRLTNLQQPTTPQARRQASRSAKKRTGAN